MRLSQDGNVAMKNRKQRFSRLLWMGSIFLLIFCLAGCGSSGSKASESENAKQKVSDGGKSETENQFGAGSESDGEKSGAGENAAEATTESGSNSDTTTQTASGNIPNYYHKGKIFLPEATGKVKEEQEGVSLDLSNTDQGYFMVSYKGSADKLMIQIEGSDNISYRYYFEPDGVYSALPLTAGDGNYAVSAYESVGDNRYALVFTKTVDVTLENEVLPFLYSNQYVNFDEDTEAVSLAKRLTKGKTEIEAVQAVYQYVTKNIVYDDEKAATVKSGYLPNVDDTLHTKKGICFDYAALMTAMLRSSGIPTRLDIGYATNIYHAWISTYLEEQGWVDNVIKFDGKNWTLMDPTFAAGGGDGIQEFITDSSNYNIQYVH